MIKTDLLSTANQIVVIPTRGVIEFNCMPQKRRLVASLKLTKQAILGIYLIPIPLTPRVLIVDL